MIRHVHEGSGEHADDSSIRSRLAARSRGLGWRSTAEQGKLVSMIRTAALVVADDSQAPGVGTGRAPRVIDGDGGGFDLTPKPGDGHSRIVLVHGLPAPTTFASFAVPDVRETPSPSQPFVRSLEIAGSMTGPDGPCWAFACT